MRRRVTSNGITVKAYSGTTGVLLAFNIEEDKRNKLLGFAISRKTLSGRFAGRIGWLQGILDFPETTKGRGELVTTNIAPIQKFRWSDYAVYRGTRYEYTVHPVYSSSQHPITARNHRIFLEEGPTIEIETQGFEGEDSIIFNRAVASSQAFSRRFPNLDADIDQARANGTLGTMALPQNALDWLSRGLIEKIEEFLAQAADDTWAIDLAIYEYHLPRLHQAMVDAGSRGAQIRVVYHDKTNDPASTENEHLLQHPPIDNVTLIPRKTSALMHNKFVVLSKVQADGSLQPVQVLAGSTNWTENGCFRQANVVHISRSASILEKYTAMFATLVNTASNRRPTKTWINNNNVLPTAPERFAGFSPRSNFEDIDRLVDYIESAQQDLIFTTAFSLHDRILNALLGSDNDSILRFGLQNTRSRITGIHRDRTAQFTAAALLPRGIEGWLHESTAGQRGNNRIHTKIIAIDLTTDAPLVISGSHNFSKSASEKNDENYLIIRRDIDVADNYLCEMMRFYDHYRFRFSAKEEGIAGNPTRPPELTGDNSWTNPYFVVGSLKESDRLRFSGS